MAQTYPVEIHHQGTIHSISVSENTTILQAAHDAGIDLPSSCCAGVCTTCASLILAGEVNQEDAMGLSPELLDQGYALLCVSYPRSPIKLESNQEEVVYNLQFGQHQQ
jgi:ferredoxin